MGDEMAELRARVRDQEAQLAGLAELVEQQREVLRRQEARLASLEGAPPGGPSAAGAVDGGTVVREPTTDRRHVLSTAATMAAGAVVGGTAIALGQSSPALASPGTFTGNPAVQGTADPTTGEGVFGTSDSGPALAGSTKDGKGLVLRCGSAGEHLQLGFSDSEPVAPPSSTVARSAGSMLRDIVDDLWWCIDDGTPGTWRQVSGPNTAGSLTLLASRSGSTTPVRATRPPRHPRPPSAAASAERST
ncbi:MAG: hypothetical protein R2726_14960 [Acidimicrobiales bacterium]